MKNLGTIAAALSTVLLLGTAAAQPLLPGERETNITAIPVW
jgi:hypothetical protein